MKSHALIKPAIIALDHLVLTVKNIPKTISFYETLGCKKEVFKASDGSERIAVKFGEQKINLHLAGAEFEPKAEQATPGSADLCFITKAPISSWQKLFQEANIQVIEGPVARTGATRPLMSLYVRDPDGNLIEISEQL